jgi:CheY-like chemotaxis protein
LPRKILLADDSVTAQNMGRRILSDAGYEVITVNNGSAALKKIAELTPDLIILDVYMPGYGGLEVCQRLKESQATARIPVLLTVGKLEPFKVEEAKRVRADAHIIKPFDSTELLAAIIRLEDKIVPQAAGGKPSRSGKGSTETQSFRRSRDRSSDPSTETGWKRRLSIPRSSPSDSSKDVREDKPKTPATAFHDFTRVREQVAAEAKLREERVEPTPQDAAPVISDSAPTSRFENLTIERIAAIEATIPLVAPYIPDQPPEAKSGTAVAESTSETVASESASVIESDTQTAQRPSDAEVMAALASLSPAASGASESEAALAAGIGASEETRLDSENAPVDALSAALAAVGAVLGGPRWVAEPIPLSNGDSHLILESEMESAYAPFELAEITSEYASSPAHSFAEIAPVEIGVDGKLESEAASHARLSPEPTQLESIPLEEQNGSPETTATESADGIGYREIAYAAAASAGASTVEVSRTEFSLPPVELAVNSEIQGSQSIEYLTSEPMSTETGPADSNKVSATSDVQPSVAGTPERETELAAAWQNWRQIRESLVGPQLTSQITEAAAAGFKQIREEKQAGPDNPETAVGAANRAAAEASTIANIVDSVFAELRPKLMEEIARKLAEERK